ncbi:MAG: S-layer homology domain-containing protein, partial [Candidatus Peregrinibacteria bacterium]
NNNGGGGNNGVADSKDVERQKKDMEKNLKNLEKEWGERMTKRYERVLNRFTKFVERAEKMKSKGVDGLDAIIKELKSAQTSLENQLESAKSTQSMVLSDLGKARSVINSLVPGTSTWEDTNNAWTSVRSFDVYWMLREALDMRVSVEEMFEGTWEMKIEIAKLRSEVSLSGEMDKKLDELLDRVDGFADYRTEAEKYYEEVLDAKNEIASITDSEELNDAIDDMQWGVAEDMRDFRDNMQSDMEEFWWDEPWMIIEQVQQSSHNLRFVDDMKNEIGMISEELALFEKMISSLEHVQVEGVKDALSKLSELAGKAKGVLSEMKSALESDMAPEDFEKFWNVMDQVERSAMKHMEKIMKYFENHPADFEALPDDVKEMIKNFKNGGPKKDYSGEFDNFYGDIDGQFREEIKRQVKDEVMQSVMREVSAELMEKLAPHIGEKAVAEILNSLNVFGSRGNELLSNSADVYNEVEAVNFVKLDNDFQELAVKTKNSIVVNTVKDDLTSKWQEVQIASESDDTEALVDLKGDIDYLLDRNYDLSIKGDEAYQFADVKLDEGDWYFDSVMTMKEDGYVSGYKDAEGMLTGEFGPSNNVTVAEALKMAMEASGMSVLPGNGGHWAEQAGYVAAAQSIGLGNMINLGNLDKAATREEIAVIVAEVFEFDTSAGYENVFSDYNGGFGGQVQAVYDNGVFTGEGDTGKFNGSSPINRASMAKVINFALDAAESDMFIEELDTLSF